jgi:hypothetical protein
MFQKTSHALGARGREFESRCPDRIEAQEKPQKQAETALLPPAPRCSAGGKKEPFRAICGTCLRHGLWHRASVIRKGWRCEALRVVTGRCSDNGPRAVRSHSLQSGMRQTCVNSPGQRLYAFGIQPYTFVGAATSGVPVGVAALQQAVEGRTCDHMLDSSKGSQFGWVCHE